MNSAKNTVVAILLLGVSYGVYQVINAPDASDPLSGLMQLAQPQSSQGSETAAQASLAVKVDDWNTPAAAVQPPPLPPLNKPTTGFSSAQPYKDPVPDNLAAQPSMPKFAPPPFAASGNSNNDSLSAVPARPVAQSGFAASNPPPTGLAPSNNNRFGAPAAQAAPAQSPPANVVSAVPGGGNGGYTGTVPALAPIDSVWVEVDQKVASGDFRGALQTLTPYHERIAANNANRNKLTDWLDALAAKVIYSTEHHLQPTPYIVQAGDSLESIARKWNVPTQLVYLVNQQRIPDPMSPAAGIELKQVPGPFKAIVSSDRKELTLYCGDLYAARFPITSAPNGLAPGVMHISRKEGIGHPCGDYCMELDQPGMALHASGGQATGGNGIGFQTADAEDLFSILSEGSEVIVR